MLKQKIMTEENAPSEWTEKRLGFSPDVLVRAVGVTMGTYAKHRQRALEKAKAFQGPDTAPPVKLVREPDNKFDPGAIKVYLGIDVNLIGEEQKWTFAHVGYIPRDFRIPVRSKDGYPKPNPTDKETGKDLGGFLLWKVMDEVEKARLPGQVLSGVNFVTKAPGTDSWGLELGVRHNVPAGS